MNVGLKILFGYVALSTAATELGAQPIKIVDFADKSRPVGNVTVIVEKTDGIDRRNMADESGVYVLPVLDAKFGVTIKSLVLKKEGYLSKVVNCPCDGKTYTLEKLKDDKLNGLKIKLDWNKRSGVELLSYLATPGMFLYDNALYSLNDGDARVLRKDADGNAINTIQVERRHVGEQYVYGVNIVRGDNAGWKEIGPKVALSLNDEHIRTYSNPEGDGNFWVVFYIDGAGVIHDVNTTSNMRSLPEVRNRLRAPGALLAGELGHSARLMAATPVDEIIKYVPSAKKEARRLNRLGEMAYRHKSYESAVMYFLQATYFDPEFARAYSNLGLAYLQLPSMFKMDSLDASNQAVERAKGHENRVLRANSHYNIGKVYEGGT